MLREVGDFARWNLRFEGFVIWIDRGYCLRGSRYGGDAGAYGFLHSMAEVRSIAIGLGVPDRGGGKS
jgi:hypothetical protein